MADTFIVGGFEDGDPHRRMCSACENGNHHLCGMQTWCECPCPGPDGVYIPWEDPDFRQDDEADAAAEAVEGF